MAVRTIESGDPDIGLHRFEFAAYDVTFAPSLGGRMLSLRHGGHEFLWRNPRLFDADLRVLSPRRTWPPLDGSMGSWPNPGGSKTWPAPQGWDDDDAWAGPPDPVLDTGAYSFAVEDREHSIAVEMASAADPRTGLRITRAFDLSRVGHRFDQRITLENTSGRTITWAPWEVAQVASGAELGIAGCGVVIPLDPPAPPVDLGSYDGVLELPPNSSEILLPIQPVIAKLGWRTAAGTIGYRFAHGGSLSLNFDPAPALPRPDDGCRVEVWMQYPAAAPIESLGAMQPSDWLVELEVMGPSVTLQPGASSTWSIGWEMA
ncbi:hypothetical protein [Agromyces italicus]|uniref:hypothetical protein n=1 Tax=Agromyces italicus TaxID=279572 RepID=UPI0003B4193B|nr:hypothetical protein [Agromyces italicus]